MVKGFISALGLDVGKKRVGVAGCDGTGLIATGLTTIMRKSWREDIAQLQAIITERQVQVLVVGMPYNLQGELGFQAKYVEKYAEKLGRALGLPIEYVDERLTSYEAEEMLKSGRISPSRNKDLIDRKAASIILQKWLDSPQAELWKTQV
jgi:putative Holliday junction resolvase